MAFDLQLDDVDTDEIGGKDRIAPGKYHFLVEELEEDGGKNGAMRVVFQCLRGTTPNQETKMFSLDFKKEYEKWSQKKLAAFAIASRLRTKEQLEKMKAERKSDPIEWTEALNRSVCMEITADESGQYAGMPKLNFDSIWRPDDKRASSIPLHPATIQREGIKLPPNRPIDGMLSEKAAPAKGNGKASATATKTAAAPAATADELLDGVI